MAKLVKMSSVEEPSVITVGKDDANDKYYYACINVNVVQLTDGTYEWDGLILPDYGVDNIHHADDETKYSVLISHIIKAYYNDHQMTAIMNNYLLDGDNEKYVKEFTQMQKIRKIAKETARKIIDDKLI